MNNRTCPQCGARVDDQTHVDTTTGTLDNTPPTTGDRSVCLYCSALNVFTTSPYGLTLRPAADTELDEFLTHPEHRLFLRAIRMARDARGGRP